MDKWSQRPSLKESKITTHMGRAMPQPGSGGFSGKKSWKIKPEERQVVLKCGDQTPVNGRRGIWEET